MALLAGFAQTDITPPLSVPYLSFYPRQTPFEGIHDRLKARAAVFDNGQTAAAVVALDALGLSRTLLGADRDLIEEVRVRIHERCGLRPQAILVSTTHAHSTPQTTDIHDLVGEFPGAAAYLEALLTQVVATVEQAWARREPMTWRCAEGRAPGIAWNRRTLLRSGGLADGRTRPDDDAEVLREPRDEAVPLLYAFGERGAGAISGYCCHPSVVQVQPLVSADYPGVACGLAESALGLDACLFLQGACGDVGAVRRTTGFHDVAVYGRTLGGEIVRQLALLDVREGVSRPPVRDMSPSIGAARATLQVPRRDLPTDPDLHARRDAARAAIAAAPEAERAPLIGEFRRLHELCRLIDLGRGPVPVEVQALRLGEALIIAVEGELFCQYGLDLKAASPAEVTFVSAYSNGYQGYLMVDEAWAEGGYEPDLGPWTRVGPGGTNAIAAAATELASHVWQTGEAS